MNKNNKDYFGVFDSHKRNDPPGLSDHVADFLKRGGKIVQLPPGASTEQVATGMAEVSRRKAENQLGSKQRKPGHKSQIKIKREFTE